MGDLVTTTPRRDEPAAVAAGGDAGARLSEPVGLRAVGAYWRDVGHPTWTAPAPVVAAFVCALVVLVPLTGVICASGPALVGAASAGVGLIAVLAASARCLAWLRSVGRRVRLHRLAGQSGLAYLETETGAPRPGRPLLLRRGATSSPVISSDGAVCAPFVVGVSRPDRRRDLARWPRTLTFAELPGAVGVPDLTVRRRVGSVIPRLGSTLGASEVDLEDAFAERHRLFIADGFSTAGLRFVTVEVIAALRELSPRAELEVSDSRVYVYLPGAWPLWRPSGLSALLETIRVLSDRIAESALVPMEPDIAEDLFADPEEDGVAAPMAGPRPESASVALPILAPAAGQGGVPLAMLALLCAVATVAAVLPVAALLISALSRISPVLAG